MLIRICAITAILFVLIGCASSSSQPADSSTIEVSGHASRSPDGLFLEPCDIREVWRLEGETSKLIRMLVLLESNHEIAYVRVRGYKSVAPSNLQRVYDRLFVVTEVLEVRKSTEHDCLQKVYPA